MEISWEFIVRVGVPHSQSIFSPFSMQQLKWALSTQHNKQDTLTGSSCFENLTSQNARLRIDDHMTYQLEQSEWVSCHWLSTYNILADSYVLTHNPKNIKAFFLLGITACIHLQVLHLEWEFENGVPSNATSLKSICLPQSFYRRGGWSRECRERLEVLGSRSGLNFTFDTSLPEI